MPELPEVETIRLGLHHRIVKKSITAVTVTKNKIVRGNKRAFAKTLVGNNFTGISRRGKLLIFSLSVPDTYLLVHLKMTGQLIYQDKTKLIAGGHQWPPIDTGLPNAYTHIMIEFADGSVLYFNDLRQFGYMHLVNGEQLKHVETMFGIEPLSSDFTWEAFKKALARRTTSLKATLLNQKVIAGIGNIYADEISFHAGVRPDRRVSTLSEKELKALYKATRHVLTRAMKYGGTTFRDYRDADGGKGNFTELLKVYGRGGLPCKKCRNPLIREKLAGRGTVYCAHCQV